MANARTIGDIINWDQELFVKQEGDRFYWNILTYDSTGVDFWEEIPEYLFLALNRFEDERQQAAKEQAGG
jgi:hypothetical protein